ncbi:MAG: chemotaxis protein CheW [Phycisphaerae bacterium]
MNDKDISVGRSGDAQAHDPCAPQMLVVFRAGDLRLGIDARQVREVTRAIPLSVPLPNARWLAGMITLRGQSTAVVDLNAVLGVPGNERDRQARMISIHRDGDPVCLLVDRVDGLLEVVDAELEPAPEIVADVNIRWIDRLARPETGELIVVINVSRILSQVSLESSEAERAHV